VRTTRFFERASRKFEHVARYSGRAIGPVDSPSSPPTPLSHSKVPPNQPKECSDRTNPRLGRSKRRFYQP